MLIENIAQPLPEGAVNMLEMRRVTKRFPGTLALSDVDLTVRRSEIHALVGQNGAGKSTLVKILAGDYRATSGTITIAGTLADIGSTRDARELGIGIVYQDLSLLPNLTVAENISLGREPMRGVGLDRTETDRRATEALARMGIDHIDARTKVRSLALPERQMVEIAKALSLAPRILILDEPTAALTQDEAGRLFAVLRSLRRQDIGIIYITHRFKEILSLCDRATVLRSGCVVGVFEAGEITLDGLVEATLGRRSDVVFQRTTESVQTAGSPLLEVKNLSVGTRVCGVTFAVRQGEIVGICGLLGAGQSELGHALFGDREEVTGSVELHGRPVSVRTPHRARGAGVGFLSDSRREEGVFPDMTTEENIGVASLGRFVLAKIAPLIRKRLLRREAAQVATKTNIAPSALGRPIRLLSGGNQQKALLSRWLMRGAEVFVFLEPTLGVDVGAKIEVYRQLEGLAAVGKGVILISTDVPEILGLSDRILVMEHGRIARMFERGDASEEKLILAMQGAGVNGTPN
ncbi:MAG: sugar ABC transporter ATP-binding protein [Chloroflexota bacterium]|nr:MAG: sugar ABC transporter ATP-binding protein [Chloroflexota bacterium]